ncbi:PREDICTED: guanine nucleotide-binding protein subunit alpha-11-like [Nanorana parkeri]|uniref:guanine nucleotide-binding protein subunit alpha-11-like n=1 Tax=Nanorana parkeri TaxID=125878 RepID=UPI000854A67B|nr:PREDICTED: guanine nucleotide-binding protein subunit alpha-11-like [Nanorana parkeri]XP_018417183.1 PREDICTED: guanine nucleotide-binding protein subunit alpha-11-like [Nanorana parkeri]
MSWWCLWCFCPPCLSEDDKASLAIDREINRMLKFHKSRDRRELKILLLGTGESGKSTFIKQMRIIHGTGFSVEDRKMYAILVHQNIVTCAKSLVGAMETLQVPYSLKENKVNRGLIKSLDVYNVQQIERHHATAIRKLWSDPGVRKCYEKRREFQLLDSAYYYLSNLERITEDGYLPTNEDIVRIRMPTTGINEYCFTVDNANLRIVDVGGQKSERKKWIHCFENVNALIYLASLSEYDQQLEEKKDENRMRESMALFKQIMVLPWFIDTPIIVFLNKTDLLAEKVYMSDLAAYFPNFKGPRRDAQAATQFIKDSYKDIFNKTKPQDLSGKAKKDAQRIIFLHATCATDTENIQRVFQNTKEAVLQKYLTEFGIV